MYTLHGWVGLGGVVGVVGVVGAVKGLRGGRGEEKVGERERDAGGTDRNGYIVVVLERLI
jgi:hypothetical protein